MLLNEELLSGSPNMDLIIFPQRSSEREKKSLPSFVFHCFFFFLSYPRYQFIHRHAPQCWRQPTPPGFALVLQVEASFVCRPPGPGLPPRRQAASSSDHPVPGLRPDVRTGCAG